MRASEESWLKAKSYTREMEKEEVCVMWTAVKSWNAAFNPVFKTMNLNTFIGYKRYQSTARKTIQEFKINYCSRFYEKCLLSMENRNQEKTRLMAFTAHRCFWSRYQKITNTPGNSGCCRFLMWRKRALIKQEDGDSMQNT